MGAPEQRAGRRRLASAGAVIAGFLTVVLLSIGIDAVLHATGVYPPMGQRMADRLFVLALAYRCAAAFAGAWVTARLAPERPVYHVVILAIIGTVAGLGGVAYSALHPELGPLWYAILLVVTGVPFMWAGAVLGQRRAAIIS